MLPARGRDRILITIDVLSMQRKNDEWETGTEPLGMTIPASSSGQLR